MFKELSVSDLDLAFEIEQIAHIFPWTKPQFEKQLQKKNCNFGIWEGTKLCGFICLQRIFPEAEIFNIVVDLKYQGKGLGKTLLNTLMNQLKQEKFKRIYLEVRKSNQQAIRLYESLGFNQFGKRENYYPCKNGREDALMYAIELL